MRHEDPSTSRRAMVVLVAGLLAITTVPLLVSSSMQAVLSRTAIVVAESGNPLLATAPRVVTLFFPMWGGLSMAAGAALLVVARPIARAEAWAQPAAVGLLAIPSITGAFLSGPTMFFAREAAPNFVAILLIGLVPYFILLLSGPGSKGEKLAKFFVFLFLGVTAAWSFSNGGSSLRMLMARPEGQVLNAGNYGFLLGIPAVMLGVVLVILAIPILAARKRAGRLLASSGLLTIAAGTSTFFLTHPGIMEFPVGILLAGLTLALVAIPSIGGRLVEEGTGGRSQPAPA